MKLLEQVAFRVRCLRLHVCHIHGCPLIYHSAEDTDTWTWGTYSCPKCEQAEVERKSELRLQLTRQIKGLASIARPRIAVIAEQEQKPAVKAYAVFDNSKTPAELVHRGPEQMGNGMPNSIPLTVIRYEIHANEDSANNALSYWQGEGCCENFEVRLIELHPVDAAYAVQDWMLRKPAKSEDDAA